MKGITSTRKIRKKHTSRLRNLLRALFISKLEEIPFIVFLSFLLTFIIARSYVYITANDIMDLPSAVFVGNTHVHHLNFGIIILVVSGFVALYDITPKVHRQLAIFYGIGLGLTFDEFALWLRLQDDYYASITYDAIITISVILLNIIYFPNFWKRMGGKIKFAIAKTLQEIQIISNFIFISKKHKKSNKAISKSSK